MQEPNGLCQEITKQGLVAKKRKGLFPKDVEWNQGEGLDRRKLYEHMRLYSTGIKREELLLEILF